MDKQSSDERLLKIIEGSKEPPGPGINIPGAKKKLFGQAARQPIRMKFDLAALKGIFKDFTFAKINAGLIGLGFVLTLIFIFTLFSGPVISKSNAAYFTPADAAAIAKFISTGQAQGLLRKNIGGESLRRDFFLPANLKVGNITAQESSDILEGLKDFKLVGIIWSKDPEVMIENSKDLRTYTLKSGESFNEQFRVKEILRNSVILEVNLGSQAQEYELR
jgi:hypothetical protein